jgi:glycine/D-amino acid oxidase-like deaminating enzyme
MTETTKPETDGTARTDGETESVPAESIPAETEVLVIGGGVAGLSAAIFTARAAFDTLVVSDGEPILQRNAHLENYPGFPAGVNPRQFLDMTAEQAERAGAKQADGEVVSLDVNDAEATTARFTATLSDGTTISAEWVLAASWSDSSYLDGLPVERDDRGSKTFLQPDGAGRTAVDGLYAAGRLADAYHQTVVVAGHGAQAALTLIHESDRPFYHDWVAPDGYFTDRGRDLPPGCEEIDADEQERRQQESREVMRAAFAEPHPDDQPTHPSLRENEADSDASDDGDDSPLGDNGEDGPEVTARD